MLNGGLVTVGGDSYLAYEDRDATVNVDGSGSKLAVDGDLTIGDYGTGTLTVSSGGTVMVGGGTGVVTLGSGRGSHGTLNIGSFGGTDTSGTFSAAEVKGKNGTAVINFNQTDDINFAPKITGSTSVNQKGAGITHLTAASTYSGTTNIDMGVLALSGSLVGAGDVTVAGKAALAGSGAITTAMDKSIFINGLLNVQQVGAAGPATFALSTSGTGSIVMGADSFIAIDLFTGAGLGDNTLTKGASDLLSLTGKLDATAGGTLLLNNPNAMTAFAGGDQWQFVNLNNGDGQITGTLGVNDSSLGLATGFVGSFDQTTGIYSITDKRGEIAAASTCIATAEVQGQVVISTVQSTISDINGRLFNLRAGGGEVIAGTLAASLDEGVIVGQGDGPEDGPVARKVARAYQWEVYTTVNFASINQDSISSQAGVHSTSWTPGIGIERHLSPHWAVGFALSLMETHQTYTSGLGTLDMEGMAFSAYASYVRGAFWGEVLYNFGRLDLQSERNPGLGLPVAFGDTTAFTNTVQFNTGWNFRFQNNTLVTGPFVGIDYLHATVNSYSESGGGLAALAYSKRSYDSLVARVGWTLSKQFNTQVGAITPQVRVAFERQNIENNNGTSVNLINQPFTATATSQSPGQEYMMAGAGVNFQFNDRLNLLLTYQGQFFRQDQQAHYAGVRIGYKF